MGGGSFSQRRLLALARESQAMELRLAGATYDTIGAQLGVSIPGAYKIVLRACQKAAEKHRETAREVLALELQRLDRLLHAVWPLATAGSLRAIDRVLKIMERRSKFLGLDAPTKTFVADMGDADILRELANSVLDDPENAKLLDAIVAGAVKGDPPSTHSPDWWINGANR